MLQLLQLLEFHLTFGYSSTFIQPVSNNKLNKTKYYHQTNGYVRMNIKMQMEIKKVILIQHQNIPLKAEIDAVNNSI